jgi:membrane protein
VNVRKFVSLVKRSVSAWIDDYAPSMGAALSYYTVFSLAPLLVIVVSVAGLVFGEEAVRGELFGQVAGLMGAEAAKGIQNLLAAASKPSTGALGTVVGAGVLLVGATTVFGELQDALDRIWQAPARAKTSGWWALVRAPIPWSSGWPTLAWASSPTISHACSSASTRRTPRATAQALGSGWPSASTS